jgi:hypothetical protein
MKSYKGKEVDVSTILENNSKVLAAGNMRVNTRGDLIGRAGKILKTREQLENEYYTKNPDAVKQKKENPVGFNRQFAEYRDEVLNRELVKEPEKSDDPYKDNVKTNPNLSTNKNETVKFVEIVKDSGALDNLPLDDEFEISDNPEPKGKKK